MRSAVGKTGLANGCRSQSAFTPQTPPHGAGALNWAVTRGRLAWKRHLRSSRSPPPVGELIGRLTSRLKIAGAATAPIDTSPLGKSVRSVTRARISARPPGRGTYSTCAREIDGIASSRRSTWRTLPGVTRSPGSMRAARIATGARVRTQASHLQRVQPRFAGLVPRLQRAAAVVLEKEAGAEQAPGVRVAPVGVHGSLRQLRRLGPALLHGAHARQLAEGGPGGAHAGASVSVRSAAAYSPAPARRDAVAIRPSQAVLAEAGGRRNRDGRRTRAAALVGHHDRHPAVGRVPAARELVASHGAERRARWIVQHHGRRQAGDHDHVVEAAGSVFDQHHRRPPAFELSVEHRVAALDAIRIPAAAAQVVDERGGADARGALVHQVGERFGRQAAFAPEAKDHRGRRAAAQGLGLGNVRNIEDLDRSLGGRRRGSLGPGSRRRTQQPRAGESRRGAHGGAAA